MTIELKNVTHIIDTQAAAEETMLREIKTGVYTLENPYVKLNPYLVAPLTALIYFQTPEETETTVTVKGKEAAGDMSFSYPKAKEHYIQVLGLYENMANTVEISAGAGGREILTIQTEKAPANVLKPSKIETSADYLGNLCIFLSPTSPAATAAYDYKGDVRWFSTLNHAFDLKRIKNGRLLIGTHRLLMPPYHVTGIFEMGLIGKIYNEFRVPGGYHHDEFEMEDGNILILTQAPARGTVEDMCVLVERQTGRIIDQWDYQTVLPQFPVGGSGTQDQHDWFHNNAVWYDKKTHSLTFSGRHQDIIINIGYDDKKLNWIIGDPEGWPEEMQKYFFQPVGDLSRFDWQYEQHACVVLPDGSIMCFDNGHWRSKVKSKYLPAKDNFSRGVRYRINTEKMEIEQVWQFGKERGADFYSPYICNVEYYGEGHYMVHSGGIGYVNGEPYDLPAVAAPKDAELRMNSVTVEIKDDKILYEMQIPANYYRAEKLSLYCPEDVLTFGKGQLLGTLGVTEEFDTVPDLPSGGPVPDKYGVKLAQEKDRLVMKAVFEPGQMVMLLLEGEETHAYFIPTTKRPFLAMCVGTFLENDERAVEMPISFEGLSGKFKLSLIIDEYKYDTGCEIQI